MTIAAADLRQYAINPALSALTPVVPVTAVAGNLVMVTGAIESDLGTWLSQIGGPALGLWQIEPASLFGLLDSLTMPERAALAMVATPQRPEIQIEYNLAYAAAICRLFYWKIRAPLPPNTVNGLWGYYKQWYNTPAGAATFAEFVTALKLTDLGGLPMG